MLWGIEAIVNLMTPIIYANIGSLGLAREFYIGQFLLYLMHASTSCLILLFTFVHKADKTEAAEALYQIFVRSTPVAAISLF